MVSHEFIVSSFRVSSFKFQSFRFQVSSFKFQVSGFQAPGFKFRVFQIGPVTSEVHDRQRQAERKLETLNLKLETRKETSLQFFHLHNLPHGLLVTCLEEIAGL